MRALKLSRFLFPAVVLFITLFAQAAGALAERRVALVIGNSAYRNAAALPNPKRDAAALADKLKALGYEVTLKTDLDYDQMRRALRAFSRIADGADVAVVFYAGHGMEAGGVNYLIPVDAKLETAADLDFEAITLNKALGVVDGARKLKLVMLDACRDNPFAKRMKPAGGRTRSIGRGLARVEPSGGNVLVAYAARAGTTADDGDGAHSPFTQALLDNLAAPGLDVRLMLGKVRDEVKRATGGRQEPFINGSLGGETISLAPAAPASPAKPALQAAQGGGQSGRGKPARPDAELAFQKAIIDGTMKAYEAFLAQFPDSPHAAQIRKLAARMNDDRTWDKTRKRNTIAAYESYLIAFPDGSYASQARRRLAALRAAAEGDARGGMERKTPPAAASRPAGRDCGHPHGPWRVINISWNDVLNIREGPGTDYGIVYGMPPDARGISLGRCVQRGRLVWCVVRYKCHSGWAARKYLARAGEAPPPSARDLYRVIGHTWPDMLNVRSGPGTNNPVTSRIPDDGVNVRVFNCVSVRGYKYKWCRVNYRGNTGWAYAKYLASMRTGRRPY